MLLATPQVADREQPFRNFGGSEQERATIIAGLRATPPLMVHKHPVAKVWDFTIGPHATRVRGYRPALPGPLPIVVYFHGGGWVFGDLETHDAPCRTLANAGESLVFNVDYGLAPEHRFPEPLEECAAVTRALATSAADLGGDPNRIVVAGASAGANLAAAVALAARANEAPRLAGQMLFYPALDATMAMPSYRTNASGYNLSAAEMAFYWDAYAGDTGDRTTAALSPLHAADVDGLPPTIIHTAEFDVLRDEGERYGARLAEHGIPTVTRRYDGQIHGFASMSNITADAAHSLAEMGTWLRKLFVAP